MGVRIYTAELHDKVLNAFAARRGAKWRGQISEVARETGCARETVVKAWESGWPDRDLPPIRELLQQENVARRVIAQRTAETAEARRAAEDLVNGAKAEVDKLKEQAAKLEQKMAAVAEFDGNETAKIEIAMVRQLSAFVLVGLSFAHETFTPETLRDLSQAIRDGVKVGKIDLKEATRFYYIIGQFAERLAHAGEVCMDMERKRVGDPTTVVRVDVVNLPEAERRRQILEMRDLADFTLARLGVPVEVESVTDSSGLAPGEGDGA